MLLLVAVATAQELPWECPPITEPADADVYRDGNAGESAVLARLIAMGRTWDDYACDWVETSESDGDWYTTLARVCDDGVVRVESWSMYDLYESEYTITVSVPSGETYTAFSVETWQAGRSYKGGSGGSSRSRAAWTGAIDGLPDDGWLEIVSSSREEDGGYYADARTVETPACTWSWHEEMLYLVMVEESVQTESDAVVVLSGFYEACSQDGAVATLNGASVGAVDRDTWARDLADADGDGFPAGPGDCDDADPTRSECLYDWPNDGLDQDCDGADDINTDLDLDGFDSISFGGTDCDDGDEDIFPGARDRPGDGVDKDCDGADDIDADGDGYTADGDSRDADCDDAVEATHPGGLDVAGDGQDGDCDGADDIDADGDGYTADGDSRDADCDDADRDRSPGAEEVPYDGIDQDCDGTDTTDVDEDGEDALVAGGLDCDDTDRMVKPDVYDHPCDGVDQDCDGTDGCPPSDEPAEEEEDDDEVEEPAEKEGCGSGAAWLALLPAGLLTRRRRREA